MTAALELERAMDELSDLYRQVIQWRNYERLPFEEIGQRLRRSEEAARKVWAAPSTSCGKT